LINYVGMLVKISSLLYRELVETLLTRGFCDHSGLREDVNVWSREA